MEDHQAIERLLGDILRRMMGVDDGLWEAHDGLPV